MANKKNMTTYTIVNDQDEIRSIIYSKFLNDTQDFKKLLKKIKEDVTKCGFPFDEYLAHAIFQELPLQPAKELIYNEFTDFTNKTTDENNAAHSHFKVMITNLRKDFEKFQMAFQQIFMSEKQNALENLSVVIDNFKKDNSEENENGLSAHLFHIIENMKTINKMFQSQILLEHESSVKHIDELRDIISKNNMNLQNKITKENKMLINGFKEQKDKITEMKKEFDKGLVNLTKLKDLYNNHTKQMTSNIEKSVITKFKGIELLDNKYNKNLLEELGNKIDIELKSLQKDLMDKYNEIKTSQDLQKQNEQRIQDKLEEKFLPFLKIKHNTLETEELCEKLEKKLNSDIKSLRDKINSNHSKLSDKINKEFNDKDKNELLLQIKECDNKISSLKEVISKSDISLRNYVDSKIIEKGLFINDLQNDLQKHVKKLVDSEVSKIKSEYNKKIINIQNDFKVFENNANEFYKNQYLIEIKKLNDLICKLSNKDVKKNIELEDVINKLLEKGFNELNKKMDEKISTIFNVAFVPAYNPVPLQPTFTPPFQPMMNNGYNCNFPELKST